MENWKDQGIVLAARPHGENGAIVSILTAEQGRYAGYVRGAHSSKMRGCLEVGSLVDVTWSARVAGSLGSFQLELVKSYSARVLQDSMRLAALQSACALCDQGVPEREKHEGLFHGMMALFDTLDSDVWGGAYIMWEIAFLRELGFRLELSRCAGGGDANDLFYISPKSGRAVSKASGEPYKDRLIALPEFLKPSGEFAGDADVIKGLQMTGYFLTHWAFAHHSTGVPEARLRFQGRVEADFYKQATAVFI